MYFPIKSILQQILERSNLAILAAKVDTLFSDIAMMPSTQCNVRGFCKSSPPGGILDVKEARMQLYSPDTPPNLHGVMIGRGALANPCMLVEADALYGDELPGLTRRQALDEYCAWLEERHAENGKCTHSIHQACKPVHGIFHGLRNGRRWRNVLDQMSKDKKVFY